MVPRRPRNIIRTIFAKQSLAALLILLLAASCHDNERPAVQEVKKKVVSTTNGQLFEKEAFTESLQKILRPVDVHDSIFRKHGVTLSNGLAYTYQLNGYKPLWVEENGVTEAATTLIKELDSLQYDGLDPEKYSYSTLSAACESLKQGKGSLDAVIAFDTTCTKSYLRASRHLLMGVISPKLADDQWFHTNDTVWNAAQQLATVFTKEGKYPSLNNYRSKIPTYALLQAEFRRYYALSADKELNALKGRVTDKITADTLAIGIIHQETPWIQAVAGDSLSDKRQLVRAYQDFYGLNPTGRVDSITANYLARQPDSVLTVIRANMERLRWLPQSFEEQYVLVDIPLMELFYRKGAENTFHMRVVVGKPARQTPALNANMANVVFSPPWGVPPTILKKEVIPGIAKRGGSYLTRKGLKAYNHRGKVVNVAGLSTKSLKGLSFRQAPGARNALGEVKFNLPNKWDIYLHDTPHRGDFAYRNRARSSGCVRVQRPKEFAEFILKELEGRSFFTPENIDSIIQTRRTRFEQLDKKIPVHLIYLTAFEDSTGQRIRFLSDIYHRDSKVIAALNN